MEFLDLSKLMEAQSTWIDTQKYLFQATHSKYVDQNVWHKSGMHSGTMWKGTLIRLGDFVPGFHRGHVTNNHLRETVYLYVADNMVVFLKGTLTEVEYEEEQDY